MPAQSLQSYDQGVMRLLQNVQALGSMIETLTQKVDRAEENIGDRVVLADDAKKTAHRCSLPYSPRMRRIIS